MINLSGYCDFTKGIFTSLSTKSLKRLTQRGCYFIDYAGTLYNKPDDRADEEYILDSFINEGPAFVSKLNGCYSFVIWDGSLKLLYLYRDRIGAKPLFYYPRATLFHYGLHPKDIFYSPHNPPHAEINLESMQHLLGIGPARLPGYGVFKGLKEVLPGHYLTVSAYGICDECYWDIPIIDHKDDYKTTVTNVSALVRDAIRTQAKTKAPLCTLLSGGLDSSVVTAITHDYLQENGHSLSTYSFDFTDNDKYFSKSSFQPEQDRPYVDQMLERYKTNHSYLYCDEQELFDALFDSVEATDLPGMADIDASLLFFCSKVSKNHQVALTGECSDEIFGGYPWFYRDELLYADGFPWSYDIEARTTFLNDSYRRRLDLEDYAYDVYLSALKTTPDIDGASKEDTRRMQIAYLNIKWFMVTLLNRMERASSVCNLDARVPFADHRIIEYVFNIPWDMKYRNNTEKSLLREATKHLLPDTLLYRKKSPYPKTYHPGYEALLCKKMYEILTDSTSPILPLIDIPKALEFIESKKSYSRPWYGQLMAGPQLIAYYIQLDTWMRKYNLELP